MKRRALALSAGLLLALGLMPGSTLAIVPGTLDQHNDPGVGVAGGAVNLAQTFTAGKSGLLSGVDLYLSLVGGGSLTASIEATASGLPTGSALASGSGAVSATAGWVHFAFPTPLSVVKDSVYAIVINPTAGGVWHGSTNTYPGGQAFGDFAPWQAFDVPADFGFRTYVDTATAQLVWNHTQITAGTSTPLTLTATMTYLNGPEIISYSTILVFNLPLWFTVNSITCPAAVPLASCNLADLAGGQTVPATDGGDTLTFIMAGTANPAPANLADQAAANGHTCLVFVVPGVIGPNQPLDPGCAEDTAAVTVGAVAATPAPTAPPTSTGVTPASDSPGSTIWLLPLALVALFSGLLVLVTRRRRRIS
jgi:hypothetical protein